jgi:integrase
MASRRAKTLDDPMFQKALAHAKAGGDPERDTVILMLSFKAGLRAKEIAGLEWADITDANGDISSETIFVPSDIAKGKRERTIPMNPKLYMALMLLKAKRPKDTKVVYGGKRCKDGMSANSLCVWLHRFYSELGLLGCSSHSGRRTFITNLARKAGEFECSLRDVQLLAGHKSVATTEKYIDISPHVDKLVRAI